MNGKHYFTINEAYGEQKHIGTIVIEKKFIKEVAINEMFRKKIKTACETHFDEDVVVPENVVYGDALMGRVAEIELGCSDESEGNKSIFVTETWLY